ncbi:MAG TPA: MBOAT family O-acyltransferase [bacterium]|nr:MBOAT family O-acyltransferase [bacterium]HPN42717.1 MBOAT family O-acyltransferase [bacterium]
MLYNSIEFAIFLPIVFILYWFVINKSLKLQNLLLLIASYVFYGWWDWRFLSLVIISSLLDYFVGYGLSLTENERKRKLLILTSIMVNLGLLGFFKYFNFFVDSFVDAFTFLGQPINPARLNIVLPVGISFYTFQTLSYSIDVYKRQMQPTRDFIAFLTYVTFFPQLVAGPIERAINLLPQFYVKRTFHYEQAADGMRQILWGLFKKIVIADNCATIVNQVFANYSHYNGSALFLGVFFFAFQIYADFSGYSDIAIGAARLFGFKLMRNFAFPYFSRDIAEFWRRWHISLTTWFRDYLYIPLGGSKGGNWMKIRNTFIIFLVSGFWHGANWTFLVWGFINALYFLPLLIFKQNRKNITISAENALLPPLKDFVQMCGTFFITLVAWVFFRANTLTDALLYLQRMFSSTLFSRPEVLPKMVFVFIFILISFEWLQRKKQHALAFSASNRQWLLRWAIYGIITFIILFFPGNQQEFIYFQF